MSIIHVVLGSVLVGGLAVPQIGTIWTYALLREKSDVVVIAHAVTMRDTGRKASHPSLRTLPVVEMSTEFEVLDVIKGSGGDGPTAGDRINLHHYRHDMDQWRADHPAAPGKPPPGLLGTGSVVQFADRSGPYLLFLVRTKRGFEPVSGHTWPHESVVELRKQGRPPG